MVYFCEYYFSVNFHFPENDKRHSRDFFTIYTLDHGLSVDGIKSILSSDNICLVLYTIFRKGVPEEMQVGRISAVEYFENSLI